MSPFTRAIDDEDACGLQPENERHDDDTNEALEPNTVFHAVVTKVALLWENGSVITYSFFGGTEGQKKVVDDTIPEWTLYANLNLRRLKDNDTNAIVRIGFDPNVVSKSRVGKDAQKAEKGRTTMNLNLDKIEGNAAKTRRVILHEWGHALGMKHEHQSPAREGVITYKEDAAEKYYRKPKDRLQSQVINMLKDEDVSNFSALDTSSIMMYPLPSEVNEQGINVVLNTKLSDMDKAYMIINYPHLDRDRRGPGYSLKWALDTAGVPARQQSEILAMSDADGIRTYFSLWCKDTRAKELAKRKLDLTRATTSAASKPPKGSERGLFSGIAGVLNHPALHRAISNVVNATLTQRGLSPHVAPGVWSEDLDVSYDAQPGVLSTNAISSGVWSQHGLNVPSDAQQGLLSVATSILRHPAFHKAVSTVVDAALIQRGVQPRSNAPVNAQQALLSDIGSLFGLGLDPQHAIAMAQYSNAQQGLKLDHRRAAAMGQHSSNIQQGLFTGIVSVLKHPAFQKVVHTAVNLALVQNGISPSVVAAASPNARQGLLEAGFNPQAGIAPSYVAQLPQSQYGNSAWIYGNTATKAYATGAPGVDDLQRIVYSAIQPAVTQAPSVDVGRQVGTANFAGA